MSLIVAVNTIAECLRTDCNILGDDKKKLLAKVAYFETENPTMKVSKLNAGQYVL